MQQNMENLKDIQDMTNCLIPVMDFFKDKVQEYANQKLKDKKPHDIHMMIAGYLTGMATEELANAGFSYFDVSEYYSGQSRAFFHLARNEYETNKDG